MKNLKKRADELFKTGKYRNWTAAHREAVLEANQAATKRHRNYINKLGR